MKIPDALAKEIRRGSLGYLAVRVASGGLVLLSLILLTRMLGASEYGKYSYSISIIALIVTGSQLGLPTLILRETARAQTLLDWQKAQGLWRWSLWISTGLAISICLALIMWKFAFSAPDGETVLRDDTVSIAWVALLVPPFIVILNNRVAILRGLHLVIAAPLFQKNIAVVAVILGVGIAAFLFGMQDLSAELVFSLELSGFILAIILAGKYLKIRGRDRTKLIDGLSYQPRLWFSAAVPLGLIVGLRTLNSNVDVLMLGWFVPASEIGLYKIAVRVATVALLGQELVVMVMSSHFARLHSQGQKRVLEALSKKGARITVLLALLAFFFFLPFGKLFLGLVFGPEFEAAYSTMMVIVCANILAVSAGICSTLLNMTGYEKYTAMGSAIATIANIPLNLLLIPSLGIVGAAIATGATVVLWNFFLWRAVRVKLEINPGII